MRKIILLLAAGLLLLAGCSDIVQQENDTDSSSGGTAGAFLRVTAETEGFAAQAKEASARTALPTIDESAVTDSFTYTLKGTKEGGSEETLVSGKSLEYFPNGNGHRAQHQVEHEKQQDTRRQQKKQGPDRTFHGSRR